MTVARFDTSGSAAQKDCAMALGWFDGLHIGHTALIGKTVEAARENGLSAAVWTFEGCKKAGSDSSPGFILSDGGKAELLRGLGIDTVFSAELSEMKDMSAEDFVRDVVIGRCRCEIALCGFNYRFGSGGAGNADTLSELMRAEGKRAFILPPVKADGETASSTLVRSFLAGGRPEKAAAILGRPFSLSAPVAHGRRVGHKLGFPTINQSFPEGGLIPLHGVYVTEVTVAGKTYRAVSNVGVHPTFGECRSAVCESNLLSGDPGECYGETAETRFLSFIRPERRFDSAELLRVQIEKDIIRANEYFESQVKK